VSDIRIVDEKGEIEQPTAPQPIDNNPINMGGFDFDSMAISQVLGMETDGERAKYGDDIKHIIEWAKLEGYENPTELKFLVRNLINTLGTPAMSEKLVTRVSRYAYLKLQEKKIQEEQNSLLR
jgi:hypothetical protein